jgi:radical SAM superfamily enzyme YgiQ (UPF0313 family)
MKVTFLMPPALKGKAPERIFGCNYGLFYQPNIFILYPASMLEEKGHKVVVLDCPLEKISWNGLKNYLKNDNSDMYIFYTVFLAEETDKHAAKLIRETVGNVPIVFMGPEPTSRPNDFTLDENTFVARGEAEYTIIDFVSNLKSRRFNKVQGLTWMNVGKIVHNPPRELIKDLDRLPFPDRRLIKKELYFNPKLQGRPSTVMLTSRNCYGRCIYCCHPDTVVDSSEGFKNIYDVKGTLVRTHTGEFQKINEKFVHNYEGEIIEITARRLKIPTKLTPNHEVFIWDKDKIIKKPAGELTTSDMLYFPRPLGGKNDIDIIRISDFIPKKIDLIKEIKLGLSNKLSEEKIKEIFELKKKGMPIKRIAEKLKINRNVIYTYTKWDKDNENLSHRAKNYTILLNKDGFIWYNMGKKKVRNDIKLTPELLRLFGYFIAEGSTSVNINRHNSINVTFSLNKSEREYAEEIKNTIKSSFNIKASETLQNNCLHISFSNSILGRFFENFGKEAKEKHIPDFLLKLPHEKLRYIIEGIIKGDGSKYNKNGFEIATSSRKLAYQIINIFLIEGIVPEFTIKKNKESKIGGRIIKEGILYRIRVSSENLNSKRTLFFERVKNGFAVDIKSIRRLQYKGLVYNFYIDKDNSYNVSFFAVSNCIPCSYMFAREIEHKRFFNCKPPVRVRSPKNIYEEFKLLKKQGYKAVAIIDDNFLGLKGQEERIIKLCELIKPLKMEWGCLGRADQLQNENIIKSMSAAGCVYVDIGAESFDQKVLDFVHKDLKVGDIFNAIFLLKKYGIDPKINILFGTSPYETEESIKWTVRMLKELNIEWVSFDVTIPHPNTEFYKIVKNNNWFATKSKDFEPVDVIREATVNFPNLNHDKLRELVKWAYREYYLRPQYIWKRLSKVRGFQDFKELVQTAWRLFF